MIHFNKKRFVFLIINCAIVQSTYTMNNLDIEQARESESIIKRRLPSDEDFSPVRPAKKTRLYTDDNDSDYVYSPTDTAKKRAVVPHSVLTDVTVEGWPNLWERRGYDLDFLKNLAAEKRINGETLLHIAMGLNANTPEKLKCKISCIKDLILIGDADIYAKDENGQTPMFYWAALGKVSKFEAYKIYNDILKVKYPNGLYFNLMNDRVSNNTHLHVTCSTGVANRYLFNIFCSLGADLAALGSQNQSILHRLAITPPCPETEAIIEHLVELVNVEGPAKDELIYIVNLKDYCGRTALHYVCNNKNNLKLFNLLTSIPGCDVNIEDNDDHTPLFYARKRASKNLGNVARQMRDIMASLGAK